MRIDKNTGGFIHILLIGILNLFGIEEGFILLENFKISVICIQNVHSKMYTWYTTARKKSGIVFIWTWHF